MPRFTRTVLFLSTLSLLILPMGKAQAQGPAEIGGVAIFGDVVTCTSVDPLNALSHERCHGGMVLNGSVSLMATRTADRTLTCSGGIGAIGFRTRETLAEGRGHFPPVHIPLDGRLVEGDTHTDVVCRVRIQGTFHRVGTMELGRLTIDVHTLDDPGVGDPFRHLYCARLEAVEVPVPTTIVEIAVEGRECGPDVRDPEEASPTHGRDPADDTDRHG